MTLKWKFIFFTALFTAAIFTEANSGRVLLRDITSLTLYRGEYTEGRRSSPVPQLECTGGTASGKFSPKVVQCYNRGWDGKDVQWECQAEMPADYQFGRIDVSCEGYDYPNDPYILAGSCGLRYELDYSAAGASKTAFPSTYPKDSWLTFEKIISILVILFIVYLVYSMLSGNEGTGRTAAGGGGGGSWPGNPPDDGRRPPPPGWNPPTAPPPSYDDACGGSGPKASSSNQQQRTADSGPGFYSGLGLGALGGYFFGRGTGTGSGYGDSGYRYRNNRRHYGGDGGSSSSYFDSGSSSYTAGPSTSSASSSTHTSTGGFPFVYCTSTKLLIEGYGGTSRR